MDWLLEPIGAAFFQRALVGGALAATICALAGTWVVLRGMAFLGEALSHGMLPGVAVAMLLGWPAAIGAAASAAVMGAGISLVRSRSRLSSDTAIGLLFVGMLALGVVIVSTSRSFAVDLTAILFGDILAVRAADLAGLAVGVLVVGAVLAVGHRAFVALAFDERKAETLGLRPGLANAALVGVVTLAVVASYGSVGTLLVVALLLAPAAAAAFWARRVAHVMALAALLGIAATWTGLLVSWHAGTAAGATIALTAVLGVAASGAAATLARRVVAARGRDEAVPLPASLHAPERKDLSTT